jgi:hypothetical protein
MSTEKDGEVKVEMKGPQPLARNAATTNQGQKQSGVNTLCGVRHVKSMHRFFY